MSRDKILSDHERRGKRLIPPFTAKLGELREISWINTVLPEIFWIALIQDHLGMRDGVRTIAELAQVGRNIEQTDDKVIYCLTSHFSSLSDKQQKGILEVMSTVTRFSDMQRALRPLLTWYPACPLRFLLDGRDNVPLFEDIQELRTKIAPLFDKISSGAMMAQATAIYLAFDAKLLFVSSEISLAKFPEIENYPHTEESRRIGASIRATMNFMFNPESPHGTNESWPIYFWNRGLEITACETAYEGN